MKKVFIAHSLSVILFGLLTLPLTLISDALSNYPHFSVLFLTSYAMLILNYIVFDLREKFDKKEEMKSK